MKSWATAVVMGFARALALTVVTMLVPIVWAAAVLVAVWWAGNPWSWIPLFVFAIMGTLALARPVCALTRQLVARWTGTVIPDGHVEPEPVRQMATGFWWNGRSYSRTAKEARQDQRLSNLFKDPAAWREFRFQAVGSLAIGLPAAVPAGSVAPAVLAFTRHEFGIRLLGVLAAVVAVAASPYAWRTAEPISVRFLRPSAQSMLADRVDELTAQRADSTVAQAAEIRRIERDLHDGAQARLVALGLALATAEKLMETDPKQAKVLMQEARAGAATSLTQLRELIQGISPPVLNERGLVDAVRALALDSPLDITVSSSGKLNLDPPIESALYFAIAELLTNTIKHARATKARICITRAEAELVVEVEDNGQGGAEARPGGGLDGLRRRLAVFDGVCEVSSPVGGPTTIRMTVPCESL